MTTSSLSMTAEYFDRMYDVHPDPWGFDTRWYERRKHALTVAALPLERYGTCFEPGCANGALTEVLRRRCDRLVATERNEAAFQRSRRRFGDDHGVSVLCESFPEWWPDEPIDLLVISELGYYLTDEGLERVGRAIAERAANSADVVCVHYTGETNYPRSAEETHAFFDSLPTLIRRSRFVDEGFELGVWRCV